MNRHGKWLAAILLLALGACAPLTSERVKMAAGTTPQGTPFQNALHGEYVSEAKLEIGELHIEAAELWTDKALAAAGGKDVAPEAPASWALPEDTVADLTQAHGRLTGALGRTARTKIPKYAAIAQRKFDCWVEEQSENHQPDDIAACRKGFEDAIDKVEVVLGNPYIVFFGFDKSGLDAKARGKVASLAAAIKRTHATEVIIAGHADRSGRTGYNQKLSDRRADAVVKALVAAGVSPGIIKRAAYGETQNRVQTKDGQREAQNRRVEMTVRY